MNEKAIKKVVSIKDLTKDNFIEVEEENNDKSESSEEKEEKEGK